MAVISNPSSAHAGTTTFPRILILSSWSSPRSSMSHWCIGTRFCQFHSPCMKAANGLRGTSCQTNLRTWVRPGNEFEAMHGRKSFRRLSPGFSAQKKIRSRFDCSFTHNLTKIRLKDHMNRDDIILRLKRKIQRCPLTRTPSRGIGSWHCTPEGIKV